MCGEKDIYEILILFIIDIPGCRVEVGTIILEDSECDDMDCEKKLYAPTPVEDLLKTVHLSSCIYCKIQPICNTKPIQLVE